MPKVAVTTLGCKVNQYDSQAITEAFQREGFDVVPFDDKADVYVINTCAVTARSEAKSRQLVRKVVRNTPEARVVVTGCYSQVKAEEIALIPGVSAVAGTGNRLAVVDLAKKVLADPGQPLVDIAAPWEWEEIPVSAHQGRTRAYVKVQDGCEQFCSYCIVPRTRGPSRSRPLEKVVGEVRGLVQRGYREVVLSGVHLGQYEGGVARLLRAVTGVEGLGRVRLSSIEALELTDEVLDVMASSQRVCRHLHIPLQSGSDRVLSLMNRRYTSSQYLRVVERARAVLPGLGLTTDVMVGFPGEEEAEFLETLQVVDEAGFSRLHVFRYSERPGTPAANMPGRVTSKAREERAARLSHLGKVLSLRFNRGLVGRRVEVLVETLSQGKLEGHSSSYVRVVFPGPEDLIGEFAQVEIGEALHQYVIGDVTGE